MSLLITNNSRPGVDVKGLVVKLTVAVSSTINDGGRTSQREKMPEEKMV